MRKQVYGYIVDDVVSRIANGGYREGEKLPTEKELCGIYGASQSTIKKALKELNTMGYIYSVERVGNYVKSPEKDLLKFAYDYTTIDYRTRITGRVNSVPVSVRLGADGEESPDGNKAILMEETLKSGEEVISYRKMYILTGRPAANFERMTPEASASFMDYFRRFTRATRLDIDVVDRREGMAGDPGPEPGDVFFRLRRWDYDAYGKEMSYSVTYIKGENFGIQAEN